MAKDVPQKNTTTTSPLESSIQQWLNDVIGAGEFWSVIRGKETVAKSIASLNADQFVPSFPIDYLMRKRAVVAASNVLCSLPDADIVTSSSSSISLDRSDMLYPDFVLCQ